MYIVYMKRWRDTEMLVVYPVDYDTDLHESKFNCVKMGGQGSKRERIIYIVYLNRQRDTEILVENPVDYVTVLHASSFNSEKWMGKAPRKKEKCTLYT